MQDVAPSVRQGDAAVEVNNEISVIGGAFVVPEWYMNVHGFSTETLLWSQGPFTGDAPETHSGHSAILVGASIGSSDGMFGEALELSRGLRSECHAFFGRGSHAAVGDVRSQVYLWRLRRLEDGSQRPLDPGPTGRPD